MMSIFGNFQSLKFIKPTAENLSSFIQLLSFLYTNKLSSDKGAKYNYDDGVNKMNSIEVRELKIASCG